MKFYSAGLVACTHSEKLIRYSAGEAKIQLRHIMTEQIDAATELVDSLTDLRMSPHARENGRGMAPPPRRKSFSKLRRRLSQTFRFSFNGSLSEFPHSFVIREEPERERSNGNGEKHFIAHAIYLKRVVLGQNIILKVQ